MGSATAIRLRDAALPAAFLVAMLPIEVGMWSGSSKIASETLELARSEGHGADVSVSSVEDQLAW